MTYAEQVLGAKYQQLLKGNKLLYLSARDIAACNTLQFKKLMPLIEEAYRLHMHGACVMPKSQYLRYHAKPSYDRIIPLLGYLGGDFHVSGLKLICSSTSNVARGWPRASGLLVLSDPETNRPFGVLEASLISATRTAAVTALALKYLSDVSFAKIGLLGLWKPGCRSLVNV